jgi:opacity protein-like surface antigen
MRQWLASAIAVIGLCAWMSTAAYAQYGVKDNFEINLFGGGSFYSTKDFEVSFPQSLTPVEGEFRLNHATWRAGVRVGVYTRGHWSEEFFYSYEPNRVHLDRVTPPTVSTVLPIRVHNYGISALYYFSENENHSVRPFLSIGVGGTLYRLTDESESFAHDPLRGDLLNMHSSNEFALNYGVGIKTRTANWVGFRADIKGFLGRTPNFGIPRQSADPTVTVFPVGGALSNAEASAGVVFYFFGKR